MPLVVANWKMNLSSTSGTELVNDLLPLIKRTSAQVVICPPFTLLEEVGKKIKGSQIKLGAQDCSFAENGAYTGDISAPMLKDCGCEYVILGHSERRHYHHESESLIQQKATIAHQHHLKTIICAGESYEERKQGNTLLVLERQLLGSIPVNAAAKNLIIAYEPVWAIGSNQNPSGDQLAEVTLFIRQLLLQNFSFETLPIILYGGSVSPTNAQSIGEVPHLGGVLVGKASLVAEDFVKITENICKQSL